MQMKLIYQNQPRRPLILSIKHSQKIRLTPKITNSGVLLFLLLIDMIESIISHINKIINHITINGMKKTKDHNCSEDFTTSNQKRKGNNMEIKIWINVFLDTFGFFSFIIILSNTFPRLL